MVAGGAVEIVNGILELDNDKLCKQPVFLILRAGGEIIVFFFLAVGILLTKTLKDLERDTHYERTK